MAKRMREEEHGSTSVEELCQSVKRLQTMPPENRFPGNDPSQQPYGELHKVPLEGFPQGPHQHRPMQPHRQSLGDMSNWEEPRPPAEDVNAPWLYEQTNTMLRDLHFERLQRQGHPG